MLLALLPIGIKGGVCFRIMGMLIFWLGVILAVGPFLTSNKCMGVLCKPSCKETIEFVY